MILSFLFLTALNSKNEINGLEEICRQLFLDINDLRLEKERIEFSKTWRGIAFNLLGYFFSIYCIYKLFMVIFFSFSKTNIHQGKKPQLIF